jgi:histone acetyltransferase MYST1
LGRYEIDTWYFSPYPKEILLDYTKLFVCEYTLKPIASALAIKRHKAKNTKRHPPGEEIYRYDAVGRNGPRQLSFWEIDGAREKVYCQNLCLLSKLFLEGKTCFFDVEPFYFYVLTEVDEEGHHIAAYFSKEKQTPYDYNLACIMTLPPCQRKGYGKLMISLSYELSNREGKKGSPEKPLSDLGQIGYKSFWSQTLIEIMLCTGGGDSVALFPATGHRGSRSKSSVPSMPGKNRPLRQQHWRRWCRSPRAGAY